MLERFAISVAALLLLAGCGKKELPTPTSTKSISEPAPDEASEDSTKPEEFQAKVMKVVDGDTIKVVDRDFQTLLVQLRGVDAPELAQPFGSEAQSVLKSRLENKVVRVIVNQRDEFERITGEVYEADESINVWIIRQGFGWYNHKYDADRTKSAAEVEAREAGLGLWASDSPTPPWVWKNPPDDGRLYIQGNGKSYHRGNCQTLDGRRKPISLEDAVQTHKPCQRCKPPTQQ
ncbi:MAG: thermonuclease family protein [Planctomycetaceae bacterium]